MDFTDLGPAMSLSYVENAHKAPLAALEKRVVVLEELVVALLKKLGYELIKGPDKQRVILAP